MKNKLSTLTSIVTQTKELDRIDHSRFGTIVKLDSENNLIWVDYDGNPLEKPVLAALGTPWINREDLTRFINRVDKVKLDFLDGNPSKPIIRDLLYSLNQINSSDSDSFTQDLLEIKADEIILKANKQITIQCGNTKTVYNANRSEITHEADEVESKGHRNNKVKGGTIFLN